MPVTMHITDPHKALRILVLVVTVALLLSRAGFSQNVPAPEAVPHRILLKLRPGLQARDADALLAPLRHSYGIGPARPWLNPALVRFRRKPDPAELATEPADQSNQDQGLLRIMLVAYSADIPPATLARAVADLPGVEYAEPAYIRRLAFTPNDPLFASQGYLAQVLAPEAWDVQRADTSVIVAVVDIGVWPTHPDLQPALWQNPGESGIDALGRDKRTNGLDDDGNGLIDDWAGYDFGGKDGFTPDNDPTPAHWHATHVAGIAAAAGNNAVGVAGVAFGARIMSVKIGDDNPTNPSLTAGFEGVLYAGRMGARVINCSWGGGGYSRAEQEVLDQVTAAGSVVVAAAGNEGSASALFPASYNNVLSVASVTYTDKRSIFSNYNASVGLSAPGEDILSTLPTFYTPGGYGKSSGTSMAAPVVSGAAALLCLKYPALQPDQIIALLRATADNIDTANPGYALRLGTGRLNIRRALEKGTTVPAASVLDYTFSDQNNDGILDASESVGVELRVKNLLRPLDNVSVRLSALPPVRLQITPQSVTLGSMSTGQIKSTATQKFAFITPADVPFDYDLPMQVTVYNGDTLISVSPITIPVYPSYATTSLNRITATFTGDGRIGFIDFPANTRGSGFRRDSAENLLAEGGLLIGTSADRLADVVRNMDAGGQSDGLKTRDPYRVTFRAADNAQTGTARFTDEHLGATQRVGVDVTMDTYEFQGNDSLRNQILVLYHIKNTNAQPVDNLHVALYLDWDLGPKGLNNQAEFDGLYRLGYIRNVRDGGSPVCGVSLISNQPMNFEALDNRDTPLVDGFLQFEKWRSISSGILREQSAVGDCSYTIGAGPVWLAAGADTTIAFTLIAVNNLTELHAAATAARTAYQRMGGVPGLPVILPTEISLTVTGGNPFAEESSATFTLPQNAQVSLELFNAIGQRVGVLAQGTYTRGTHTVTISPQPRFGDHLLFLRLGTLGKVMVKKLVRM